MLPLKAVDTLFAPEATPEGQEQEWSFLLGPRRYRRTARTSHYLRGNANTQGLQAPCRPQYLHVKVSGLACSPGGSQQQPLLSDPCRIHYVGQFIIPSSATTQVWTCYLRSKTSGHLDNQKSEAVHWSESLSTRLPVSDLILELR